jgi:hypothetical protein
MSLFLPVWAALLWSAAVLCSAAFVSPLVSACDAKKKERNSQTKAVEQSTTALQRETGHLLFWSESLFRP